MGRAGSFFPTHLDGRHDGKEDPVVDLTWRVPDEIGCPDEHLTLLLDAAHGFTDEPQASGSGRICLPE